MSDVVRSLVDQISDGLARENRLLQQGRANDALRQSEMRTTLLEEMEQELSHLKRPLPLDMKTAIEKMLFLNQQNASMIQAALAGYLAAKDTIDRVNPAAGYAADGRRVYPASASTKKHL